MKTLLTFLLTVTAAFAAERADVVVIAATPAGIAAAVSAARSGSSVILLEEKSHVGGVVSAGLTNTDIYKKAAVGGLFAEFVKRVREHYVTTYGGNSEQVKVCRGGHMFEAKVAEKVFRDMLAGEKNIRVIERQRVISARVVGGDGISVMRRTCPPTPLKAVSSAYCRPSPWTKRPARWARCFSRPRG